MNLKTVKLIYNFNAKKAPPRMSANRVIEFNRKRDLILQSIKKLKVAYLINISKDLDMNSNTVRGHLLRLIESGEIVRVKLDCVGFFVKAKKYKTLF